MKEDAELLEAAESNKAFTAMVSYAVSEESGTNAWADLVKYMAQELSAGLILAQIEKDLKATETYYKIRFGTPLPNAWRSAKSSAIKAVKYGVALLDSAGNPVAKSALEAATKAARGIRENDRLSPAGLAHKLLDQGYGRFENDLAAQTEFAEAVREWLAR